MTTAWHLRKILRFHSFALIGAIFLSLSAPQSARAGLDDCLDAVVNSGKLSLYLADQATKLGLCGDKLAANPPVSAAITAMLAGLALAGIVDSEASCQGLIGSTIGMLLIEMLEEAPSVKNAFEQAFGKSIVDKLINASAEQLADTLANTPGLDRVFGLMNCGCTIVGTLIETKDRIAEIAGDAGECGSIIGDALDAVADVLVSGAEAIGNYIEEKVDEAKCALLGDCGPAPLPPTICYRDDGTPIHNAGWNGNQCTTAGKPGDASVFSYCPAGKMNINAGGLAPMTYANANDLGFCQCKPKDAGPSSILSNQRCFCGKDAKYVDAGPGQVQCVCAEGRAYMSGACVQCNGPVYKTAGGYEYCGCPSGKALNGDGQCVPCGSEPGSYVDDTGYCRSFTCASKPGLKLVSIGNTPGACTYELACDSAKGEVWNDKKKTCETCGENKAPSYFAVKEQSGKINYNKDGSASSNGQCISCGVNQKSKAGDLKCETFTCKGTDHLDVNRPHQCVACKQTTTINGVTMCLDQAVEMRPVPDKSDPEKEDPCATYIVVMGTRTCLEQKKRLPSVEKTVDKAIPAKVKPGDAVQKSIAPSLDDIGPSPYGSNAPNTNSRPGGGGFSAPMNRR